MEFKVGTRVEFLHTGEKGIVRSIINKEMVNVELIEDEMEIPAYIDDLITTGFKDQQAAVKKQEEEDAKKPSPPQAKQSRSPLQKPTQRPKPSEWKRPRTNAKPIISTSQQKPYNRFAAEKKKAQPPVEPVKAKKDDAFAAACYVAFEPMFRADGEVHSYQINLINHTNYTLIYQYTFSCLDEEEEKGNGSLKPYSFVKLDQFHSIQLNDAPQFWLNCRPWTTDNKEYWQDKLLKVKAKQFFKKMGPSPLVNKQAHLYLLLDNFFAKADQVDLKAYTQKLKPAKAKEEKSDLQQWFDQVRSPEEVAAFPRDIDLHIEKLHDDYKTLSKGQMVSIQLRAFEQYMEDVISMNLSPVSIIHGRGKGRLRNEILLRLLRLPAVARWEEDHANGGVTRVFLKEKF